MDVRAGVAACTFSPLPGEGEPPSLHHARKQVAYLRTLHAINHKLAARLDTESTLACTLSQAMRASRAERGCLFVANPATGQLELRLARRLRPSTVHGQRFQDSLAAVERAWRSGQPALAGHAGPAPRPVSARRASVCPRSMLCVPLSSGSQPIGVLYLDRRLHVGPFQAEDLALLVAIAGEAAAALHVAERRARKCQAAIQAERRRMARHMHDTVIQSVYSIGLAAQTALRLLDQPQADGCTQDHLRQIQETSQKILAEMRQQIQDLHPSGLAQGRLAEVLARHCHMLREHYSLELVVNDDLELVLSACQREALYFVAREALWNIVRHSGAKHVAITLSREDGRVLLSVVDDGVGFDPSLVGCGETVGLRTMRERLELVRGTLELDSRPGTGTRVTARIPLP